LFAQFLTTNTLYEESVSNERTHQATKGRTGRILCLFIALSVIFALAPFAATAAYAVSGTMNIGGTAVSDLTANDGGTGWTWTAGTATLTLGNAYTAEPIAINCTNDTDNIKLAYSDSVSITSSTASAIYCNGNLEINGSGGTLSVTSSSSNALYCAFEINGALTVASGTVNATAAASYTNPVEAAVIYGKRGVTVSGNANLTTTATGAVASGIYVELGDILISTSGTVTANGTGTGGALAIMNGQDLLMNRGTLALTGTPMDGVQFVDVSITGGTVTIDGIQVYLAKLTLDGVSAATAVTAVTSPVSGYAIAGTATNASGEICFLLPAGSQTVTLTAGGDTYTSTFTVAASHTNTATISIPSSPPLPTAPTITTTTLPNGTVGAAYSQTLTATGTAPITWTLDSGTLPAGLTLSIAGVISGTPTAAGTATFTVKANGTGSDTKQLSITINAVSSVAPSPTPGGGGSGGGGCDTGAGIAVLSLMAFSAVRRRFARRGR
jgi:hypothetical protein